MSPWPIVVTVIVTILLLAAPRLPALVPRLAQAAGMMRPERRDAGNPEPSNAGPHPPGNPQSVSPTWASWKGRAGRFSEVALVVAMTVALVAVEWASVRRAAEPLVAKGIS